MSEQQAPPTRQSACPHPEAVGTRWGDPISEERQAELKALADKQREWATMPEAERGESPFLCDWSTRRRSLTGADVFWLAASVLAGPDGDPEAIAARLLATDDGAEVTEDEGEFVDLNMLHLEEAGLRDAHLEGAVLHFAHLERAGLSWAHLEGAILQGVHLEGAVLVGARLVGAGLQGAHLEGVILQDAHLEAADLTGAGLERANLERARLETLYVNTLCVRR